MRGDPRIEIGKVSKAHGSRGEVVLVTHDPESDLLEDIEMVWVGGVTTPLLSTRCASPEVGRWHAVSEGGGLSWRLVGRSRPRLPFRCELKCYVGESTQGSIAVRS